MAKKKFVPVADRIKRIQSSNDRMKKHIIRNGNSMRKVNSSSISPQLKTLKIKKLRALQTYLQSAIIYNTARIKNLKSPS